MKFIMYLRRPITTKHIVPSKHQHLMSPFMDDPLPPSSIAIQFDCP